MTGFPGAPFFVTMVTGNSHARVALSLAVTAALLSWPGVAQAQRRCRVSEVAVSPADAQVRVGATFPFVATAYDPTGIPCGDVAFAWQTSASDVVTIDANGIATGVGPGTAVVTARTGVGAAARSGRSSVTVVAGGGVPQTQNIPGFSRVLNRPTGNGYAAFDRQPEGTGPADGGLYVDPLRLTLVRGESRILDYRAVRADGGNAARVPIQFSVDAGGERIVAVDSFGLITSLGDTGTATVRAVVPNNQRIQPKTVRVEVRGDSVRFNRTVISLTPGTVETLSVFVPAQSRALDPAGLFQFTTSDTSRVKVNPVQPVVEAGAPGTARVTAQSSLYPDISVTIHVHRRVARLEVTPADSQLTLAIGGTVTLRARAIGVDGAPVAEAPLTWTVPDTGVVAFERATGVVQGRRAGTAILSVQAPLGRDSAVTRFIRVRVVAGGLAVARARLALPVGQRAPIEATILDDRRQPVGSANELLAWTSSADTIARVENNQIVAVRPGFARLTGRAPWDSTVSIAVFVAGDMIVASQAGGRWDLQMVWDNGSRATPLTNDSLVEGHSSWSRDLMRIAFTASGGVASRTPTSALWVMNADGTDRVRLTDDSAQVEWPRWMPDGRRLVFEWSRGGRSQIWMHEFGENGAPGTNRQVTTLTPGAPNTAPAVAPDGSRIAYVSLRETSPNRRGYVIVQANVDGTDERMVTSGGLIDEPVYAPDGRSLFFLRAESSRGQQTKRVYRLPLGGAAADTAVALTPPSLFVQQFSVAADGQSLALTVLEPVQGGGTNTRVVLFRIASGEVTALGLPSDMRLASPVLRPPPPPAASSRP